MSQLISNVFIIAYPSLYPNINGICLVPPIK